MTSQTRNQEYKYQYKTVSIAGNTVFCGNGPTLSISIPENLLDIKAIYIHAVLLFDVGVPSGNRKIHWAGGEYPRTIDGIPKPLEGNMKYVNLAADPTTRIADLRLDVTDLKDGFMQQLIDDEPFQFDQQKIRLNLITDVDGGFDVSGSVILWKVDFVYTTGGIQ